MRRLALALTFAAVACTTAARREKAVTRVDLGTAYLREGNPQSAITVLEQATRYDRRNWDAWNKLGLAYSAQGAPDLAERAFKRALRLAPDKADVNNNYGLFLMEQGRLDDAIEHFETATRDLTYRNPALVLSNLGFALLQAGLTDRAIRTLEEAVKRAPNLCQARFNLGLAHEKKGDAEAAVEDFQAVMTLCGDEAPGAWYHGALALFDTGDVRGACTWLHEVVRKVPGTDLGDKAADLWQERCR